MPADDEDCTPQHTISTYVANGDLYIGLSWSELELFAVSRMMFVEISSRGPASSPAVPEEHYDCTPQHTFSTHVLFGVLSNTALKHPHRPIY